MNHTELGEYIDKINQAEVMRLLSQIAVVWEVRPSQADTILRRMDAELLIRRLSSPGGEAWLSEAKNFLRKVATTKQEEFSKLI